MRKGRVLYLIFSLTVFVILAIRSLLFEYIPGFILLMIGVILPNYILKARDRRITSAIFYEYGRSCDPYRYIEAMKDYSRKCFLSGKQKLVFNLYYAIAYIDAGDFDNAGKLLLEIDDQPEKLDEITKILYLKTWCDYFYYNRLDEKMKLTLLKMKELINSIPLNNLKRSYSVIYVLLEAKYFVLTGTNLEKARAIFRTRVKELPARLSRFAIDYHLALADLKEHDYEAAKKKLLKIAVNNESLYIVRKSKQILEQLDKKII